MAIGPARSQIHALGAFIRPQPSARQRSNRSPPSAPNRRRPATPLHRLDLWSLSNTRHCANPATQQVIQHKGSHHLRVALRLLPSSPDQTRQIDGVVRDSVLATDKPDRLADPGRSPQPSPSLDADRCSPAASRGRGDRRPPTRVTHSSRAGSRPANPGDPKCGDGRRPVARQVAAALGVPRFGSSWRPRPRECTCRSIGSPPDRCAKCCTRTRSRACRDRVLGPQSGLDGIATPHKSRIPHCRAERIPDSESAERQAALPRQPSAGTITRLWLQPSTDALAQPGSAPMPALPARTPVGPPGRARDSRGAPGLSGPP